jgi:hypothetical protein
MNLVTCFGLAQHDHEAVGFCGIPYRFRNFFKIGSCEIVLYQRVRRGESFFTHFLCVFLVLDSKNINRRLTAGGDEGAMRDGGEL